MALLVVAGCDRHLGCEPVLRTEAGQLEIAAPDVIVGACDSIRDVGPVLVGTRICPHLQCGEDVEGCVVEDDVRIESELVTACFVPAVEGPATLDGDCVVIEDVGNVTWRFDAQPCAANDRGYAPASDRVSVPAVAIEGVNARLESPGDAFARRALDPGPEGAFPEDAAIVPGATVQVLADNDVPLAVVLDHPDHDESVAWNPSAWSAELVTPDGASIGARWSGAGLLVVNIPAGVEADVAIVLDDVRLPLGRVRGVPEADLASLEVAAGYAPGGGDDREHGPPIGARAIWRTADRAPVYGVPVEWEITEGAFPVWRGEEEAWGPDYIALMDEEAQACHDPPEKKARTFHGTLVATRGDFEAEVELVWTEDPEDENLGAEIGELFVGDGRRDSELCRGPGFPPVGCSCATTTSPGGWAAVAPWMLLVALTRRRRRRTP
jgi:MYXO-CTERM domain-containing protein